MKPGDFVRIKPGAYEELVKRGWDYDVPTDIDGQSAKVKADYTHYSDSHISVTMAYGKEIGIPAEFLEEVS